MMSKQKKPTKASWKPILVNALVDLIVGAILLLIEKAIK